MDFRICVQYQKVLKKKKSIKESLSGDYPCEKSVQIFKKNLFLFLFFPHKTRWVSHSASKHIMLSTGYVRKKKTTTQT